MTSTNSLVIKVEITETPNFNVISQLEGPNYAYIRYIEDETQTSLTIISPDPENEPFPRISIVANSEGDLEKAREMVNDLIQTIGARQKKDEQNRAAKKALKRRKGMPILELPQQLLIAMRYYYPGPPITPPPPGSDDDMKLHNKEYRRLPKVP